MSGTSEGPISVALQILFGVAGILGVAVALFGLHYRDSLGLVLYRRLRSRPIECTYTLLIKLPLIVCGR